MSLRTGRCPAVSCRRVTRPLAGSAACGRDCYLQGPERGLHQEPSSASRPRGAELRMYTPVVNRPPPAENSPTGTLVHSPTQPSPLGPCLDRCPARTSGPPYPRRPPHPSWSCQRERQLWLASCPSRCWVGGQTAPGRLERRRDGSHAQPAWMISPGMRPPRPAYPRPLGRLFDRHLAAARLLCGRSLKRPRCRGRWRNFGDFFRRRWGEGD
eukprot:494418-Prorocentrum_minimum.AAC.1